MSRAHPVAAIVVALAASGCGSQLDVGLGAADSGSTIAAAETTAIATSTTGDTTETSADATSATSDASSSTGVGPGTTTTETTGTTGESGGETEGLEESPCLSEQKVCAEVDLDGAPVGFCGQTLELEGLTQSLGGDRWSVEDCGACERCGGTVYEIEYFAPAGWAPAAPPTCSRISIDFAPLDDSPFPCAFTGVAIWANSGESIDEIAPVYVAASITTDPPAAFAGLDVDAENVAPKACEEVDCCFVGPGKYELTFSGAGIGAPIVLAEHGEAPGTAVLGATYDLRNERSHAHEQCDQIPHFDWILRR